MNLNLLLICFAGICNGMMDTIAHHPDRLAFVKGKFGQWLREEIRIGKDQIWMQGPLFVIMGGWHFFKQLLIADVLFLAVRFFEPFWFWYFLAILVWYVSFVMIYKGIFS